MKPRKYRKGQVVMARVDGKWTPWIIEAVHDPDYPGMMLVRDRAKDRFLLDPDRVRPLTKKEMGL